MGGIGSGRSCWRSKNFVEETRFITSRWVKSHLQTLSKQPLQVNWYQGKESLGSASVSLVSHNQLCVRYKYRRSCEGDWVSVTDFVPIQLSTCWYGGVRLWFICPKCGKRNAIIYVDTVVACRDCLGLRYQSEYEDEISRLQSKTQKIFDRIGHDYVRPKGMHHKTYERLLSKANELQIRQDKLIEAKFRKLVQF